MKLKQIYEDLKCRQILTSRGEPTVEIDFHTTLGVFRTSCPSGASTGSKEAKFITDKNIPDFNGKSVQRVLFNIQNIIRPRLTDLADVSIYDQNKIDEFLCVLDGSSTKSRLGVNAILPLSVAFSRAGAVSLDISLRKHISLLSESKMKLPVPFFNVLNGGVHSGNEFPFQEIMVGFFCENYSKNLEMAVKFYFELKKTIAERYGSIFTSVGDEGGFAPPVKSLDEALNLIMEVSDKIKANEMRIAIDAAASMFYTEQKMYDLNFKSNNEPLLLNSQELTDLYLNMIHKYPKILILEDPFAENDYQAWQNFMLKVDQNKIIVVGDDITVTNPKEVENCGKGRICNGLLVKPNQIGTVSEAIEAVKSARNFGMKIMVSHRSGETEDTFIADFSVGVGADFIKAGAPCRGERVCKYNQLLRIEEAMKKI